MSVKIATFAAGSHIPPPSKGKYEYAPPTIGRGRAATSEKDDVGSRSLFSPKGKEENQIRYLPKNVGSDNQDGRVDRGSKCQPEGDRKNQRKWSAIEGEALVDVTNTRQRRHQPPICSNRGGRRGGRPIHSSGANASRSRRALRTVTPSSSCISRNESRHFVDLWAMSKGKSDHRQNDTGIGWCLPSDKENSSSAEGIEGLLHKPNALNIVEGGLFALNNSEDASPLFNDRQKIKGEHDDVLGGQGEAPFGEDVYEALEAMYDEDDGDGEKRNDISVTSIDPMPLSKTLDTSSEKDMDDDSPLGYEHDLVGCSFLDIAKFLSDSTSSPLIDAEKNDQTPVQREQNKENLVPPLNFPQILPCSAEEGSRNVSSSLPLVISGCSTDGAGDVSNCQALPIVVTPSSVVCPDEAPSNLPSQSVANRESAFSFDGPEGLATDRSLVVDGTTVTPSMQDPLDVHIRSFHECTFTLTKLKRSMQDEINPSLLGEGKTFSNTDSRTGTNEEAEAQGIHEAAMKESTTEDDDDKCDLIAKRRVKSAVCAFGGNKSGRSADCVDRARSWRGECEVFTSDKSHMKEHDKAPHPKRQRVAYEHRNLDASSVSCSIAGEMSAKDAKKACVVASDPDNGSHPFPCGGSAKVLEGKDNVYPCKVPRYRCSQCGLPKQNHVCSVESSLYRSIGVMVYPAINAFTSHEDGLLAPPLSKMNNFLTDSLVSSLQSTEGSDGDISPGRRGPTTLTVNTDLTPRVGRGHDLPVAVTPESSSLRGSSSPSSGGSTILAAKEAFLLSTERISPLTASKLRMPLLDEQKSFFKKRCHSEALGRDRSSWVDGEEEDDGLFVAETVELRPEQFRTVTATPLPSTVVDDGDDKAGNQPYQYPTAPLPHSQRRRLYDALLELSAKVGGEDLTRDCAVILGEARDLDLWDLAVAELLTQVVVALCCPPEDRRLDGLSRYLLKLGIAC